jgi:sugar/nucleoside kinase (ribokinase family)
VNWPPFITVSSVTSTNENSGHRVPAVVVAGHICLDIIPQLPDTGANLTALMVPGSLHQIGPALLATGGVVSNTGLALHRLGIPTSLMGKIGTDPFGQIVKLILMQQGRDLANGMIEAEGEQTSYSVVISPPGVDRLFLHHPGANDTFASEDIDPNHLRGAKIFHFGYPPLMRRLYSDGGIELEKSFKMARSAGLMTSLDMTEIDRRSDAGKVDWKALLRRVLPTVDLFLPSLDEILFALGRENVPKNTVDGALLSDIAQILLSMGAAVVCLKLGNQGFYLRSTKNVDRLHQAGGSILADVENWAGRELIAPCFSVDVVGTTGSGDCTIGGFLAALVNKASPQDAMAAATATGACCIEKPDATSGVRSWDSTWQRIRAGWPRRSISLSLPGWTWNQDHSIGYGPADTKKKER